jgi:AcrR family transcriptional regulator
MKRKSRDTAHQEILEIAWTQARRDGFSALTMQSVAKEAGLTRQTIYWHFASRTQLLLEVADHNDRKMRDASVMYEGLGDLPPVESLVAMMRAWLGNLPAEAPLLLELASEALRDESAMTAMRSRMRGLAGVIETVFISRIAAAGELRHDLDPKAAADYALGLGTPSLWLHFTGFLGWSDETFRDFTIDRVLDFLLSPDALDAYRERRAAAS